MTWRSTIVRDLQRLATVAVLGLSLLAGAEETLPAAQHRYFRTSDGQRLHYWEAGSGPVTFVLVTGWMMPASVFRPQWEELARDFRVLALDPRSQGLSDLADSHEPGQRADDIGELLREAGVERFVLVGWSLGVMESLDFVARNHPEGLEGLVLIDNSIGVGKPRGGGSTLLQRLKDPRKRGKAIEGFVDAVFGRSVDKQLRAEAIASARRMPYEVQRRVVALPYPREYYAQTLWQVDVPVVYAITPGYREQAEILTRERPLARAELFDKAGHALFRDDVPRFNSLLRSLATQVLQRRGEVVPASATKLE